MLQFSNGLVVYLSGDTGITAEQDAVGRRFFGATLAVMNIGGIFSTGPREAAWVLNELVQPKAVIVSHANEAATVDGAVQPGTKTAAFIDAVKAPVHVPLSGRTMEFDGEATCVSGC
jgi:L-ascorbate metabolism protein UlaG (beta-lactamase superfamily)